MNVRPAHSDGIRGDANQIAMKVARSILAAAHSFQFEIDDAAFTIDVEPLPTPPWPAPGVEGLSPDRDGPWPVPVRLLCSWPTGTATLIMEARHWQRQGRYRHLMGLNIRTSAPRQGIVWITLALPLRKRRDGEEAVIEASEVDPILWTKMGES